MSKSWLEQKFGDVSSADRDEAVDGYHSIRLLSDSALDAEVMKELIAAEFILQKHFSEYLGVGESTVAGWIKSGSFPDYAKRAALAAYCVKRHYAALSAARREALLPRVVKDGERYLVVRFRPDEVGVAVGEVIARDIPTEKDALVLASATRAWQFLRELEGVIETELKRRDDDDYADYLASLRDKMLTERLCAFKHHEYLELVMRRKREEEQLIAELAEQFSDEGLESATRSGSANGDAGGNS